MRFLADENFNNKILRGIHLQNPLVDMLRAQDTEVYRATDPIVLACGRLKMIAFCSPMM